MNPQVIIPNEAIRDFCRTHSVRELAVFGSAVRSDFSQDSDIDILIELDPNKRIGLIALQQMRDELASLFGRPVDLLTRAGLNRHIRDQVLRTVEIIYAE